MKYENMNEVLLMEFPNLQSAVDEYMGSNRLNSMMTYELYEGIFNPYIYELLIENKDKRILTKIFKFCEQMALSDDIDVNNLLEVAILEYICDNKEIKQNAIEYMGTRTRLVYEEVNKNFYS